MNVYCISVIALTLMCLFGTNRGAEDVKIVNPDSPLYATVGGSFKLECHVKGANQNTEVSWYHNNEYIDTDLKTGYRNEGNIKGDVLEAFLEKTNVTAADDATYKCELKSDSSNFALIEVKVSEVRVTHGHVHRPGNDTHIACEVDGDLDTGIYELEWYRNGDKVEDKDDKYHIVKDNNTLQIKKVDFQEDLGEYHCLFKLNNDQEDINKTAYVYGHAYIKHYEKSKNLVQDDNLHLECMASGYPMPVVTWYFEDVPMNASERVIFSTPEGNKAENASLKVKNMQYEDAGDYACFATNEIEGITHTYNETITVRVKDKLAALWPFLGICVEVTILCIIIFIYEKHRQKKMEAEERKEEADHLTNSHANRDDVRQRKV